MPSPRPLSITAHGDREIVIIRGFVAPRRLVFQAMTQPELIRRWLLGPPGWSFAACDVDLRVGGSYRYLWRGPEGGEVGMRGEYREIKAPERLVVTEVFDTDWTGGESLSTLVFAESEGVTVVTNTVLYSSRDARDGVLASPMESGLGAAYDRLDEVLG